MVITPVKTYRVRYYEQPTLEEVLVDCLPILSENSVVAITSKIVSLCEGSFVYRDNWEKQELIEQESQAYMQRMPPNGTNGRSHMLTITNGILIPAAGIDHSKDLYIMWPSDPQYTANKMRKFLAQHYGLSHVGVIITDSTSRPLRRGVSGIPLAHSGFKALVGKSNYQSDVALGLSAAAVACMGEGGESTPLALITDAPFVEFVAKDPTAQELANIKTDFSNDLFYPMFTGIKWHTGGKAS